MNYERIAREATRLSHREKLRLAQLLIGLASEEGGRQARTERSSASTGDTVNKTKLKAKESDLERLAKAIDRLPLAEVAVRVGKLCAVLGPGPTAKGLDRKAPWVSKMQCVAEAVQGNTVAGHLVSEGSVQDLETAYHACLIEEENAQKMDEIAPELAKRPPEARRMVKRVWKSLRLSKQGTVGLRKR